jgi:hypothetical protein
MNKKQKQIIVSLVAISMLALNFMASPIKDAQAFEQPTDVSNLLSDSGLNIMATSTITFTTASSTVVGDFWRVEFPAGFSLAGANFDCNNADADYAAASSSGLLVECYRQNTTENSGTATEIEIGNQINHASEGTYRFYLTHYASDGRVKEYAEFMVAIQPHVVMHAKVAATLSFDVTGIAAAQTTNDGVECDILTTPESLDFETLADGASTTVCHSLAVGTNASDGYIVTVEQDGELRNAADDRINSFIMSPNDTGSSTQAFAWEPPVAQLDVDYTYGHMGLHSDDTDVESDGGVDFGDGTSVLYLGFNSTDPIIVLAHNGPAINTLQNSGYAEVAYTAEITNLQQAGDYYSTLTYICTPTY